MKVYLVIMNDTHHGVEVDAYTDFDRAITEAQMSAQFGARDGALDEEHIRDEHTMLMSHWFTASGYLYYARYGDSTVWVVEKELVTGVVEMLPPELGEQIDRELEEGNFAHRDRPHRIEG